MPAQDKPLILHYRPGTEVVDPPISDAELRAFTFVYSASDVPRLVAEVRRLRRQEQEAELFHAEIEALSATIEAGVDRVLANTKQIIAERDRLRNLIKTYATTAMPFEAFIGLALGEKEAAEIFERQDRARTAQKE